MPSPTGPAKQTQSSLPGESWRNGCVESFNDRLRDECLNINQVLRAQPCQRHHWALGGVIQHGPAPVITRLCNPERLCGPIRTFKQSTFKRFGGKTGRRSGPRVCKSHRQVKNFFDKPVRKIGNTPKRSFRPESTAVIPRVYKAPQQSLTHDHGASISHSGFGVLFEVTEFPPSVMHYGQVWLSDLCFQNFRKQHGVFPARDFIDKLTPQ